MLFLLLFILLLCCFGDGRMVQVATTTALGCLCILWELRVLIRYSCASPPGNWVPLCWTAAFRASSWGHHLLNLYLQSMHFFKDINFLGNDPQTQAGFAAHTVWTAGIPGTGPGRAAQLPRHLWAKLPEIWEGQALCTEIPSGAGNPREIPAWKESPVCQESRIMGYRGEGSQELVTFYKQNHHQKWKILLSDCSLMVLL